MPGLVTRFRPPLGPGVRVDTHVEDGTEVPPFYDSLLAKVIAWAPDRERALARCLRALNEFEVTGIPTTIGAAADVIRSEGFARGDYSTSYLEDVALPALSAAEA
jgi:acetyl-CoA carboxylase biotin carboxylase subunit